MIRNGNHRATVGRTALLLIVACALVAGRCRLAAAADAGRPVSISVEPKQIILIGPYSERRVLVTGAYGDGTVRDLSREARYESLSPNVVEVSGGGLVKPKADGEAKIRIIAGDKFTAEATVTVKDFRADYPISFANQIVPIMTKAGCNQGACHGAQHGKGGFKLSLLGFEPGGDYPTIVKKAGGGRGAFA